MDNLNIEKKVIVLAIGTAGIRILNYLSTIPGTQDIKMIAVDTDRKSLNALESDSIIKIEAAFDRTGGFGCGGDLIKGESSIISVRKQVIELCQDGSLVILIGGLGGGTASGGIPAIRREWGKQIPLLIVATTPFNFEGNAKYQNAITAINDLASADLLLTVSNDLLFSSLPHNVSAVSAFEAADKAMAQAIMGLSELFKSTPLMNAGYAELRQLLSRKSATAAIAVSSVQSSETADRMHTVLSQLMVSPLLGGVKQLKESNAVLATLIGGNDLTIGEMRKALDNIRPYLNINTQFITGVNINPNFGEQIQITLIALKYKQKNSNPKPNKENIPSSVLTKTAEALRKPIIPLQFKKNTIDETQPELPLQDISRGIFNFSDENRFNNEDLDIPTFQRQNIPIETGI